MRSVRGTVDERKRTLPGDELIEEPIGSLNHAITIPRPRRDVWPWLAQMGAGNRAGWYSYDFLDNGRQVSAKRIIPDTQQLTVGMIFPALPGATEGFTLLAFDGKDIKKVSLQDYRGKKNVALAFYVFAFTGG